MLNTEQAVQCPYLNGKYVLICRAGDRIYVPTNFHMDEYCKTNKHKVCSVYIKDLSDDPQLNFFRREESPQLILNGRK